MWKKGWWVGTRQRRTLKNSIYLKFPDVCDTSVIPTLQNMCKADVIYTTDKGN